MSNEPLWSRVLAKFESPDFTHHLATKLEVKAKTNLLTSTNMDGSLMTTNKKTGKPLIDTGTMLRSTVAIQNQVIANVPYAYEVQQKTGNTFLGVPPTADIKDWIVEFIQNNSYT